MVEDALAPRKKKPTHKNTKIVKDRVTGQFVVQAPSATITSSSVTRSNWLQMSIRDSFDAGEVKEQSKCVESCSVSRVAGRKGCKLKNVSLKSLTVPADSILSDDGATDATTTPATTACSSLTVPADSILSDDGATDATT